MLEAHQEVEVWSDHANLTYFRLAQKLNYQQARWRLELGNYDFILKHQPGRVMGKADLLSWRADYDRGEHDNEDVIFIKPEWLVRGVVITPKDRIRERVVEAQAGVATDEILKGLVLVNSIWYKGEAVWVPELVWEGVLKEYHDSALSGHPGV